jgi:hypothetical protein
MEQQIQQEMMIEVEGDKEKQMQQQQGGGKEIQDDEAGWE